MTFWQWFQTNGDRVCTFIALLSVALKGVDGLSAQATTAIMIAGIVATAAHQSFFGGNSQGQTVPKANT